MFKFIFHRSLKTLFWLSSRSKCCCWKKEVWYLSDFHYFVNILYFPWNTVAISLSWELWNFTKTCLSILHSYSFYLSNLLTLKEGTGWSQSCRSVSASLWRGTSGVLWHKGMVIKKNEQGLGFILAALRDLLWREQTEIIGTVRGACLRHACPISPPVQPK